MKIGCDPFSREMEGTLELFIVNHQSLDLPWTSDSFTWSRSQESRSKSRLNKFLASTGYEKMTLDINQKPQPKLASDYLPILLDTAKLRKLQAPLQFENVIESEIFWPRQT